MPAGTIHTPSSKTNTKDAVQKPAERTCTTGSGGKKLVQTRLPFKLITPVASTTAAATSTSSSTRAQPDGDALTSEEPPAQEPRKRRLSYSEEKSSSDDTPQLDQQRRSNSKENLAVGAAVAVGAVKKPKILEVLAMAEEIIELDDDDDADEDIDEKEQKEEKKTSAPAPAGAKAKIQIKPKAKPRPREKATTSPIQIKLPLLSKRGSKRRKSAKIPEEASAKEVAPQVVPVSESDSCDDVERIAEKVHSPKRLKVMLPKSKKTDPDPDPAAEKCKKEEATQAKTVVNGKRELETVEQSKEEVLNAVEKITAEVVQTVEEITEQEKIKEQKSKGEKAETKVKDAQTLASSKKGDQQKAEKNNKSPKAKKQDPKSDSPLEKDVRKEDLDATGKRKTLDQPTKKALDQRPDQPGRFARR
ncbi:neurofilament heavy polypeptide-like [Drosophila obscura]|uniref:neurofilament heavy polypeptide-like n=1 Tax=Drosophila obscura TaxID=7282 RepID=UPI001BB22F54|nr:neurofilament heavy polypeptide-like [Drosophila obscura]